LIQQSHLETAENLQIKTK